MKKVLLSSLEKIEYSQYFQSFVYFSSSTDIHTLSNIHILTYGISGATGAERRSRACVTGGISLSPLRGQSLSLSTFYPRFIFVCATIELVV